MTCDGFLSDNSSSIQGLVLMTIAVTIGRSSFLSKLTNLILYKSPRAEGSKLTSRSDSDSTEKRVKRPLSSYNALIGSTPLIRLERLSEILDCDIFVKMESKNPASTGKDRAVEYMLERARQHPNYRPGVDIVEGTSGSTGIALAFQCNALGLKLHVVMPDDQADEKRNLLERLGASVTIVPCCAIANKNHYVNTARRLADELGGIFIDQFENEANFLAHYERTGPEIWQQMGGHIDAFVMSAGTGGTIAGVSRYLKEQAAAKITQMEGADSSNKKGAPQVITNRTFTATSNSYSGVLTVLADPTGSSLLHRVKFGVCYTPQQSERHLRKHRYDSIVEGVGLDRVTSNFDHALIDTGYLIPDQEIVDMAHWLLRNEGLFVGSSSAMNVAAAVHTCRDLLQQQQQQQHGQQQGKYQHQYKHLQLCRQSEYGSRQAAATYASDGKQVSSIGAATCRLRVVTVICDDGYRHMSRFWNPQYLSKYGLEWPNMEVVPSCLKSAPSR